MTRESDMDVISALLARISVRGFLKTPIQRQTVEALLADAARSPSASNTQPWRVHVCTGSLKEQLTHELLAQHDSDRHKGWEEYEYYPATWREPYLTRRRTVGKALYGALRIPKGDTSAMAAQYGRNYEFFDAPVGLFFTIERGLGQAAWIDIGIFIQSVMLAAIGRDLGTCAQQSFAKFHPIIRRHLGIPDSEILVCGMSLGIPDPAAAANLVRTERESPSTFASFVGFDE